MNFRKGMRSIFLLGLMLYLSSLQLYAQYVDIKGHVENTEHTPVFDAHLFLYSENDTIHAVRTALSDNKGRFVLENVPKGDYTLVVSNVQYKNLVMNIRNLQENLSGLILCMEDRVESLEEVTVTAKQIIREFDRQIIFPGKQEKEASITGVDLVDKLLLSKVYVKKENNSINSVDGGKVSLRINGAPADEADFMNIDPKLVTKVEYHDRPSMRYGDVSAVIDFYVKRRETGGRGNVYLNNRVDGKAVGTGRGGLSLNHKKSEFSVSGFYSYLGIFS